MTQGYVLEVRIGVGEPASIALVPGTPLDPTSFGRSAMWRIGAEGVLDVHGYVYFDGRSVYVQSADEQFPVLVNRHRVGTAWTEIRAPSVLIVGQAQIELKTSDALARSGALVALGAGMSSVPAMPAMPPMPAAAPVAPRGPWDGSSVSNKDSLVPPTPLPAAGRPPFERGAFVPKPDGEDTRFAPIADPRAGHTSPVIPVPIPLSAAAPAPPKPKSSLWERAKADWYATSLPKRILFVLSPLVVASYFSLLFGDEGDDKHGTKPPPSASSVALSAAPPPSLAGTGGNALPIVPQPPRTPGELLGADAGRVTGIGGAKTLERAAADALTEGNLPLAIQLYDRLAREKPENPAFKETARILRERLDAGR